MDLRFMWFSKHGMQICVQFDNGQGFYKYSMIKGFDFLIEIANQNFINPT